MQRAYPAWLANLDGNRPPLSIDVVSEFLIPILKRDKAAVFIVVDCLRLGPMARSGTAARAIF